MDEGQRETENLLAEIETAVKEHYQQSAEEIEKKVNEYWRKFGRKDRVKRKQLEAGEITKEEYNTWRTGQMMMGKRWETMRDTIAADLANYQEIAKSIVNGYMPEAYAMGHNYGTYTVEKAANINTSYTLYDRQTVERIIREQPELLPQLKPLSKTAQEIATGKIKKWEKKQIHNTCMQGILQGESIPQIAERISNITKQDAKSTIRYARTMTTGAENAGRVDSYRRAEKMGIQMEQQWLATLDERTRESHRMMDGEHKPVGELFSNGCRFPGDPKGPAGEVWSCRCALIPMLTGIPELEEDNDVTNTALRNTDHMEEGGYSSYDEWKKGHMKSHKITEQKEKGENIKNAWIGKYRAADNRLRGGKK